ncbi:MAG: nickel pincer cofactor biosynthesis protein LarC, partial [Ignisphaera sp.]|nr:nickel pincer cofactor biosynthesis protein LarC [Ignisphaera sp.]
MVKSLVVDPSIAGISGDMLLSAFIGLGLKPEKLAEVAKTIESSVGWVRKVNLSVEEVRRGEFKAWGVNVSIDEERRCRRGSEIVEAVEKVSKALGLDQRAMQVALNAVNLLVEAEAAVHGEEIHEVDLCEISSADTVLDVVGAALALQELDLLNARIYGLPIAVGGGRIRFSHGSVSVPVPVVLEIAKKRNLVLIGGPVEEELATPTGVALYASIVTEIRTTYPMIRVLGVGYGAGSKELQGVPNILRLVLGEEQAVFSQDIVYLLETDVDDVTGEVLGYINEKLLSEGALDVAIVPKVGKKGRPAYIIRALTRSENLNRIIETIVRETGTLGVRV